ncbi:MULTISPECIES: hypothetical protein [Providencia]|uniref:hypothetical protein n=1 Tax=Providencia TaxID=586 RepID=UPI0012B5838F|nr:MULTISPECIES: hypothetical protein [Providencia]MTC43658.1 hypothetical protein [Providencia sp. wls1921]CAG9421025.1 hypothetical protein NVI2019_GHJFPKLH_01975 [Providencia alcalifaciens]
MTAGIEQVSTHSFKYRNFQIIKLPAKAMNPVTRFHVQRDDNSFGLFDSMTEAKKYIDELWGIRNEKIKP